MQEAGPQSPYEVYCNHCRVSAPLGARVCLHCGGRLVGQRGARIATGSRSLEEEEALDAAPRRFGAASPVTALWILLLIGGSLYRLCG
jgi:hypothetical protein